MSVLDQRGGGSGISLNPAPQLPPPPLLPRTRHRSLFSMIPQRPPKAATSAASRTIRVFIKRMIEGPLTGAMDSESASASDVTELAAFVTTNTAAIVLKAPASDLAVATTAISTHSNEIGALQTGFNGLGNSFYTKALVDGFLTAKQDVVGAGGLAIDRRASLQAALDSKAIGSELVTAQGTVSAHTGEIATL